MSNKNVDVFDKKDFFTKFDHLKFGFQNLENFEAIQNIENDGYQHNCGMYLFTTNCADPKEIELITETFLEIWNDICSKWVFDNLDKEGYALCFDTIWDKTGDDDVCVSLSGGFFCNTEEQPSLELLESRMDEVAEGAFNISLDFIDEMFSYLDQPAHCFAEPIMQISSKFQVKEYAK